MKSLIVIVCVLAMVGCSSSDKPVVSGSDEKVAISGVSEIDSLIKNITTNKAVKRVNVEYDSYPWSYKKQWVVRVELKTSCGEVDFKEEGNDIKQLLKTAKLKAMCILGAEAIATPTEKRKP